MKEVTVDRKAQMVNAVEGYFDALRQNDFNAIPYSNEIVLRAPVVPGGSLNALHGKQQVFEKWWKPLEPALKGIEIKVRDYYFNEQLNAIVAKAELTIAANGVTLRAADQFVINEEGKIVEQENHFDASPLKSYIHHICLRSMDFGRTKHFYCDILGFPLAIDLPELIIFVAGSVFLAFKKADPRDKEFTTFSPFEVGLDHIAITCEMEAELYAFTKKLNDNGVENTEVKLDDALNKLYVAFKDPDRISWEFYMK